MMIKETQVNMLAVLCTHSLPSTIESRILVQRCCTMMCRGVEGASDTAAMCGTLRAASTSLAHDNHMLGTRRLCESV